MLNLATQHRKTLSHGVNSSDNSSDLKVVILTRKRSGSSFVGELLNQNPNLFYVFEPLGLLTRMALKNYMEDGVYDDLSIKMVNATFSCDFDSNMPKGWWQNSRKRTCLHNKALKHKRRFCSLFHVANICQQKQ